MKSFPTGESNSQTTCSTLMVVGAKIIRVVGSLSSYSSLNDPFLWNCDKFYSFKWFIFLVKQTLYVTSCIHEPIYQPKLIRN